MRSPPPVRRRFVSAHPLHPLALRSLCAIALGAALAPGIACAQGSVSLDLGVSSLRQAGIPPATVTTFGGEGGWTGRRFSLAANAIAARAPDNRWTGQALGGATLYAGPTSGRWEIGTALGAFSQSNALPSASAQLVVRRHTLVGGVADLFAGAGAAATERDRRWVGAGLGQLGVAAPLGGGTATAAFTYVDARRVISADLPPFGTYTEVDPVRYGDAIAFWERTVRKFDLSLGGGGRVFDAVRQPTLWASASAAWRATGAVTVVVAAGRALEDVVRGVPEARYASLALRLPLGRGGATSAAVDERPRLFVAYSAGGGSDSTRRVVTVRVRRATTVELMADFTGWAALPLAPAPGGDAWTMECAIAPGAHRVALRVDGGAWTVPANLPRIDDDYGGTVGLITVP